MSRVTLTAVVTVFVVAAAAAGPAAAASVSITSVSIPDSVTQGDDFTIDISVSGDGVQNVEATLSTPEGLSCSPSGSQAVGLSGGSGQATFDCTADATGDYNGEVSVSVTADESGGSNTYSDSRQTGLDVLSPASLSLTTSVGSTDLDEGETTTLDAVVHNSGDATTTYTISVADSSGYSASLASGSETGDIAGGTTKTVTYDVTADNGGDYDLTVTTTGGNDQSLSESETLSVSGSSSGGSGGSSSSEATTESATETPAETATPEAETPTATPEPTATAEPDQTATAEAEPIATTDPPETATMADDTGGTDGEPRSEPTAGSGPGFTVVGAVVALLAAAVLARRRD